MTVPQQQTGAGTRGVLPDPEEQPVMQIPDVGWLLFGLKPAASYKAAIRGDFPVIQSGRRKVVPTAKLRQMLGMDGGDASAA